jgi:hypothetical protein
MTHASFHVSDQPEQARTIYRLADAGVAGR